MLETSALVIFTVNFMLNLFLNFFLPTLQMATLFGYRQAVDLRFVTGFRDILRSFEKLEMWVFQ